MLKGSLETQNRTILIYPRGYRSRRPYYVWIKLTRGRIACLRFGNRFRRDNEHSWGGGGGRPI